MYTDFEKNGIRRTIVSFDPFLRRDDVKNMSDAEVGKKYGLDTMTVRDMRRHCDVPFEVIRKLCHKLECQPGDIMSAMTVYSIPAKEKDPDA